MVESHQTSNFWPQLYQPLGRMGTRLRDWLSPASDASSNEDAYHISVELPGVSEEDVSLVANDGRLSITGEKSESKEEKGDTWYFSERQYGSFRRTFRLPDDANAEKAEAHMKDGVLEITIPKREAEEASGKKIAVKRA